MSAINKDQLIIDCANAYRTASETTEHVKAGELAEKIAALSFGGNIEHGIVFNEYKPSGVPIKATVYGLSRAYKSMFDNGLFSNLEEVTFDKAITIIDSYAFANTNLNNIDELIKNVTHISNGAFEGCWLLKEVTFSIKPIRLQECFYYCEDLTVIKVPWAEGEVDGAPWGAANAEIIYNWRG